MTRRRGAIQLSIITLIAAVMGCASDSTPPEVDASVKTIDLTLGVSSLTVGQTAQATAVPRNAFGEAVSDVTIAWSSSDTTIATVSNSGLITAVAPGTAAIAASANGKSASANITVATVPVANVSVALASPNILVGQATTATAAIHDAQGAVLSDRAVTWESSNKSVATISPEGAVTAVGAGTTSIVATSEGVTGSATLTVQLQPLGAVTVTLTRSVLLPTETTDASATLRDPSGTVVTGRPVTWSSSNSSVATVSDAGKVTAIAAGTTTIAAASGGATGSAILTVAPAVASVNVTLASSVLSVGKTTTATAVLRDASNEVISGRTVTWHSSNTDVATVSASGVVTAVSTGTATITATNDGQAPASASSESRALASATLAEISGSATLTVQAAVKTIAVSLSTPSLTVGQTTQATADVRDAANNQLNRTVAWTSSNTAVATIDAHGTIKGIAVGSATITAKVDDVVGSSTLAVIAGGGGGGASATQLAITTQPSMVVSGQPFSAAPVVQIRDAAGAVVTTATNAVTATIASGSGTISSGAQATAVNGVATFTSLRITGSGQHTLKFTATGLTSATSSAFNVTSALTTTQAVATKVGTVNTAIAAFTPVTASGGVTPYAFALSGATLPTGMTFSTTTGAVSGTPTAVLATKTFTVTVTDAAGTKSSKTFQLTVNAAIPPLSTTQAVAAVTGTVGAALSTTPVTASGGVTPYHFALTGGTLPAGLTFNAGNGLLSGTPTASHATSTFTVTVTDAASGTSSRTFTLTVNAAPGGNSTAECATPKAGWIFCDDFESDRLAKYFEYDNAGGKFVRTPSTGYNGSVGMRATYTVGQSGAGALHLAFGRTPSSYFKPADAGTANYREVYWRFYARREAGWVGNGPAKLTRAIVFSKSDFSQAALAHGWTSSDDRYLALDPASGTDLSGNLITVGYNDFAHLRWLGLTPTATPIEDQAHVGQWMCYEFHAKLNDAGQSNGVFELTVDGTLSARKTGMNWVGSYNAFGFNAVYLEQFQNDGAPAANVRVLDNFVVSTQPIGCLGS